MTTLFLQEIMKSPLLLILALLIIWVLCHIPMIYSQTKRHNKLNEIQLRNEIFRLERIYLLDDLSYSGSVALKLCKLQLKNESMKDDRDKILADLYDMLEEFKADSDE